MRGVNSCEGTHYESTLWVPGHCVQTGRVSGYVRFPDGTGIPGVTVIISSPELTEEVVTDESGYFEKDGLPYWNGGVSSTSTGYWGGEGVNHTGKPGGDHGMLAPYMGIDVPGGTLASWTRPWKNNPFVSRYACPERQKSEIAPDTSLWNLWFVALNSNHA